MELEEGKEKKSVASIQDHAHIWERTKTRSKHTGSCSYRRTNQMGKMVQAKLLLTSFSSLLLTFQKFLILQFVAFAHWHGFGPWTLSIRHKFHWRRLGIFLEKSRVGITASGTIAHRRRVLRFDNSGNVTNRSRGKQTGNFTLLGCQCIAMKPPIDFVVLGIGMTTFGIHVPFFKNSSWFRCLGDCRRSIVADFVVLVVVGSSRRRSTIHISFSKNSTSFRGLGNCRRLFVVGHSMGGRINLRWSMFRGSVILMVCFDPMFLCLCLQLFTAEFSK
eukprot:scaffold25571_cov113-Cylindrotheca_fusiformis.AAC.1